MFYAILAVVVIVALFLIFRDDHDTSYNRNEKKAQRQPEGARKQNAYSKKETSQPKAEAKAEANGEAADGAKTEAKAEFSFKHKAKDGSTHKAEFQGEAKKVMGMIGAIIEEVKKEAAEPLQDIQKGVQGVMDEAKAAIDKAMKEAGQKSYWTSNTEVDEQEQPEPEEEDWEDEEVDLSFLDNLDYYEDLEENSETFDVTGLRYYCAVHDCGKIVGYVKPDPSNVHDSRAQAVIRADGKLLGYIPRTQQDWYEDFNEENVVCPFVGEIELDNRGWLQAEIKVIIPTSQEYVEEEIEEEL